MELMRGIGEMEKENLGLEKEIKERERHMRMERMRK